MTALLALIYCAFICLGLPDSLLGSAWPAMHLTFGVNLSNAGIASMIISSGTVVSALLASWLHRRLGTGKVMIFSVLLSVIALVGTGFAPSFWTVCAFCVPLGLAGGAIDAALNNFVALHYEARHMSWLHCFWGVGVTASPAVLSLFLGTSEGWRTGYWVIAATLSVLLCALFFSLPMWRRVEGDPGKAEANGEAPALTNGQALRLPNIAFALAAFICYCGVECTAGLWAASFLVKQRGIDATTAALYVSLYYGGITVGRLLTGFLAIKLSSRALIRSGTCIALLAVVGLLVFSAPVACMICLLALGLGLAPVYPLTIHETPARFGKEASQAVIGLQMAFAYVGSTLLPPLLGWLSDRLSLGILPAYLLLLLAALLVCSERLNAAMRARAAAEPAKED